MAKRCFMLGWNCFVDYFLIKESKEQPFNSEATEAFDTKEVTLLI